jgi:hypothetical protein
LCGVLGSAHHTTQKFVSPDYRYKINQELLLSGNCPTSQASYIWGQLYAALLSHTPPLGKPTLYLSTGQKP